MTAGTVIPEVAGVPTAHFQSSAISFFFSKVWEAFDSTKNYKRLRHKRQSVTAKREKSQTPKFV